MAVDDYTNLHMVQPMRSQADAFHAFQQLVLVYGMPTTICLDNGSNLVEGSFLNLAKSLGIQLRPAVPACKEVHVR